MKPVAFMADSGKVITADDAEMLLKHSASYFHIRLFSADQLREAQVKVLREAADWFMKGHGQWVASAAELRRMADEIERSKT